MASDKQITFKVPEGVARRLDADARRVGEISGNTYARKLILAALSAGVDQPNGAPPVAAGLLCPETQLDAIQSLLEKAMTPFAQRLDELGKQVESVVIASKSPAEPETARTKKGRRINMRKQFIAICDGLEEVKQAVANQNNHAGLNGHAGEITKAIHEFSSKTCDFLTSDRTHRTADITQLQTNIQRLESKIESLRVNIRRAAAYILIQADGAPPDQAHAWAEKHFGK